MPNLPVWYWLIGMALMCALFFIVGFIAYKWNKANKERQWKVIMSLQGSERHFDGYCDTCGTRLIPIGWTCPECKQDECDEIHHCADCGSELQIVRPGKWQCPECE